MHIITWITRDGKQGLFRSSELRSALVIINELVERGISFKHVFEE